MEALIATRIPGLFLQLSECTHPTSDGNSELKLKPININSNYSRIKLSLWAQCYIGNLDAVICAYYDKSKNGDLVKRIKLIKKDELLKSEIYNQDKCIKFLAKTLRFVFENTKNGKSYVLKKNKNSNKLSLER